MNSQHLVFEAAKAHHYGLTEEEAFQTVTSVPANTIGLGHRIGSLKVGYDADVVIWDRSPLELGATPLQVFVDGVPLFDEKKIDPVVENKSTNKAKSTAVNIATAAAAGKTSFVLTNIGRNFLSETHGDDSDSVLVVDDGKIVCYGQCTHALSDNRQKIDINGGYVVPVSMKYPCCPSFY